jgi:hypothetical protein
MCLDQTNPCVEAEFTFGVLRELWQKDSQILKEKHNDCKHSYGIVMK